jgi:hypothetical protein
LTVPLPPGRALPHFPASRRAWLSPVLLAGHLLSPGLQEGLALPRSSGRALPLHRHPGGFDCPSSSWHGTSSSLASRRAWLSPVLLAGHFLLPALLAGFDCLPAFWQGTSSPGLLAGASGPPCLSQGLSCPMTGHPWPSGRAHQAGRFRHSCRVPTPLCGVSPLMPPGSRPFPPPSAPGNG